MKFGKIEYLSFEFIFWITQSETKPQVNSKRSKKIFKLDWERICVVCGVNQTFSDADCVIFKAQDLKL